VAIRTKLTERDGSGQHQGDSGQSKRPRTEEEKATRTARVVAAKDALKRSAELRGDHVAPARTAIKTFLQRLNEQRQPDDAAFKDLIEAPFRVPPKKREQRR
jgi:hypothetical protein